MKNNIVYNIAQSFFMTMLDHKLQVLKAWKNLNELYYETLRQPPCPDSYHFLKYLINFIPGKDFSI